MMVQPVVSRSQRRMERKQLVLIVALVIAIAGASFSLGVLYGRRSGEGQGLSSDPDAPKLPMVTKIAPPPKPQPDVEVERPDKLTFYDNLPKGDQAPLGSGINLPPQEKAEPEVKTKEVSKPVSQPAKPEPLPQSATPLAAKEGAFVVQVASFRTSDDAGKLADRLKGYQLVAYIEKADLGEKGIWYRVLSGPYTDREKADQAVELLRQEERLSALVRQK